MNVGGRRRDGKGSSAGRTPSPPVGHERGSLTGAVPGAKMPGSSSPVRPHGRTRLPNQEGRNVNAKRRKRAARLLPLAALLAVLGAGGTGNDPWVTYPGGDGPGKGKHVVLVS